MALKTYKAAVYDFNTYYLLQATRTLYAAGVFSSGIYLCCNHDEGNLIMIHDSQFGAVPFGLAADSFGYNGHELGIRVGDAVQATESSLCFESSNIVFDFAFKSYPVFNGVSPNFLEAAGHYPGFEEDDFYRVALPSINLLRSALKEKNPENIQKAVNGLVGLGRGLTPTYDDFLSGVMYYFNQSGRPVAFLNSSVLARLKATNKYSAVYLKAIAEGKRFSLLDDCLCMADENSFSRLLSMGSSSGHDMLAGMRYAADISIS